MPKMVRRDSDGDPVWSEPEPGESEWDLDDPVELMGRKALCAAVARDILGCQIKWSSYYGDWCCSCRQNVHGCDQQCSASMDVGQLYSEVIEACDKRGIALLAQKPEPLLRSALASWRAARRRG